MNSRVQKKRPKVSSVELLCKEWDNEKNQGLDINSLTLGSNAIVFWLCSKCGSSYSAMICKRAGSREGKGTGCPYCAGKKVNDTNSLQINAPNLVKEWSYELNKVHPSEVSKNSGIKVWWNCSICNKSWEAAVNNRIAGTNCPYCSSMRNTSFIEQSLFFYLKKYFPNSINRYIEPKSKMEIDIFVPDILVGVEYDSYTYHKNFEKVLFDEKKNRTLNELGIKLIRIREIYGHQKLPSLDLKSWKEFDYKKNFNNENLNRLLENILEVMKCEASLSFKLDINVNRDKYTILHDYYHYAKSKSLDSLHPNIARDWDYEKNYPLLPSEIGVFSDQKVHFICSNGHKSYLKPKDRVKSNGCTACKGTSLNESNNLHNMSSSLIQEWDYEKNKIDPKHIRSYSHSKVDWICSKCGYKYTASIAHRLKGTGCPKCAGQVLTYDLSLMAKYPEISKEFDVEKNQISANEVFAYSNKRMWWKCSKGHSYFSIIQNRTRHNKSCPYCSNQKVLIGYNDLESQRPEVLKFWDYELNININPNDFVYKSGKNVRWHCKECGKKWIRSIRDQRAQCSYCGFK